MLEFELPYPPSVNHYWRRVGARTIISRKGREFRDNVVSILVGEDFEKLDGDLEINIWVYPPDRRRRDIDNTLKSLLDSLQHGGAYYDDNQIVKLTAEKCEPIKGGKAWVVIRRLESEVA